MSEPYWWFEGESVQKLIAALRPDSRLEVHHNRVARTMHFVVRNPGEVTTADRM